MSHKSITSESNQSIINNIHWGGPDLKVLINTMAGASRNEWMDPSLRISYISCKWHQLCFRTSLHRSGRRGGSTSAAGCTSAKRCGNCRLESSTSLHRSAANETPRRVEGKPLITLSVLPSHSATLNTLMGSLKASVSDTTAADGSGPTLLLEEKGPFLWYRFVTYFILLGTG